MQSCLCHGNVAIDTTTVQNKPKGLTEQRNKLDKDKIIKSLEALNSGIDESYNTKYKKNKIDK